jgi:hypothetical protein
MGQPSEGLPLQNKKWPLRSEITQGQKNVAHHASCCSGYVRNLFASIAYQAWFDKNVCESSE